MLKFIYVIIIHFNDINNKLKILFYKLDLVCQEYMKIYRGINKFFFVYFIILLKLVFYLLNNFILKFKKIKNF